MLQVLQLSVDQRALYYTAVEALRYGINVLPIVGDGSKRPPIKWERYQHERVTLREVSRWFLFLRYPGLGFVTGPISKNMEVLDFDSNESYFTWREQMRQDGRAALAERIAQGYLEASPGGYHLPYRCKEAAGNQKLAVSHRIKIETRGKGGLFVAAPSGSGVHPSGKSYQLLQGGVSTIQVVTPSERQALLCAARALDESLRSSTQERAFPTYQRLTKQVLARRGKGVRPGDLFNQRASWDEVLGPYGWRLLYEKDDVGYWTKHEHVHATTNYNGSNLLYVFSTTTPFEPRRGYSLWVAYVQLKYKCLDSAAFTAAARDLAAQGYCCNE